MHTPMKIGAAG